MMVHIPNVLSAEQVGHCRAVMERASCTDGRVTAGHQSGQVKKNLQLPENGPEAREPIFRWMWLRTESDSAARFAKISEIVHYASALR